MKRLFGISKMRFKSGCTLSALVCVATTFGNAYAEVGNPRVNQVGYTPNSPKIALYKTDSIVGQAWQLKQNGTLIASGNTIPRGDVDAASGDNLHSIDFSNYALSGTGYTLTVGNDSSYPFDVSSSIFSGAFYDSLKYFYHNRSGIAIETAYTGGGNTSYAPNAKLARPAGHLNQGVNKGDVTVPCWTGTCNYSLNVSKGWYDAGDHGKYVVNGGISVWTLLNMYEVASQISYPAVATNQFRLINALGDGKLNIPESTNGVPDILDEARWQLEFLLAMQVPAGQAKAGMVHHKVHDVGWTGLPLAPHEDSQQRALVPPSTAATLNLAATAAQCARIWKNIDTAFASKCLIAAERAWAAAQVNPNDIYSGNYDNGGGGYGDAKVTDEFYWAAAELFITTGQEQYLQVVTNYSHTSSDFGWADTEVLGVISLASASSSYTAAQKEIARQRIIGMANLFVTLQNESGYLSPVTPLEYYWGSNSVVANRLILMGLAYNFTGEKKFANGVISGVDYLFGRNTLSFSFVTGHGEKALQQPHHRFWAGVLNANYPMAPPGALSGGPNTGLEDSVAAAALAGCKPAACFMDDINSWSTNEITINWNAPFAWVLGFYNEYASVSTTSSSSSFSSSSVQSSIASSMSSSVVSSMSSSSRGTCTNTTEQCNWYGTLYPICQSTQSGWGWENQRSCISRSTCATAPNANPIAPPPNCPPPGSSSSSVRSVSSSSVPLSSSSISSYVSSSIPSMSSRSSASSSATMANCQYVISNQWSAGFTGAIRIKNNSTSAINTWNVSWNYTDGSKITSSWNANVSGSNPYAASNLSWNSSIQPGQTVEFGFQGTKGGANAQIPVVTGSVCQ